MTTQHIEDAVILLLDFLANRQPDNTIAQRAHRLINVIEAFDAGRSDRLAVEMDLAKTALDLAKAAMIPAVTSNTADGKYLQGSTIVPDPKKKA